MDFIKDNSQIDESLFPDLSSEDRVLLRQPLDLIPLRDMVGLLERLVESHNRHTQVFFSNIERSSHIFAKIGARIDDIETVTARLEQSTINAFQSPNTTGNLKRSKTPIDASCLLSVVLAQPHRDSLVGDLEERYGVILKAEGSVVATRWFWQEVTHSFLSLAWDTLKRVSRLEKLIERYRRIGS